MANAPVIVSLLLLSSLLSNGNQILVSDSIDPRSPSEVSLATNETKPSIWPWVRIRELEDEQKRILQRLTLLPQHRIGVGPTDFGYHSPLLSQETKTSADTHEIIISYPNPPGIKAIALAPAINPREPKMEAYSFPKRFLIEVQSQPGAPFQTVVDWSQADFPDPGAYPAFFSGISTKVSQLRFTALPGSGETFPSFALGELFLFRTNYLQDHGENAGSWLDREIRASGSLDLPPIWSLNYLVDGATHLGSPLSNKRTENPDLLIVPDADSELSHSIEITLDLGEEHGIGRVDIWPGYTSFASSIPSFGFPGKLNVRLYNEENYENKNEVAERLPNNLSQFEHVSRVVSVFGRTWKARYVVITLSDLPYIEGRRILSLGEIMVSTNDLSRSLGARVSARGIPDKYHQQLPLLVDGFSQQRRILQKAEWIKGLSIRRPLDRRLAEVEETLSRERAQWEINQKRLWIAGSILFILLSALGIAFQLYRRRQSLEQLRNRIARDLHDEVGSNLGSISLSAERLEQDLEKSSHREELAELSLLSREASASLNDVVWFTGQSSIQLSKLASNLGNRARRVLTHAELTVKIPDHLPDHLLPFASKRHLMMLFKEAIHNCARHSDAKKVEIEITVEDNDLKIRIADDGLGFDPEAVTDGWGLRTMSDRARELGGHLEITSRPQQGSSLTLITPLSSLFTKGEKGYQTSN